jgi:hypothetical protein
MLRLFFCLFAPLRLCGKHSYKNKNLRTCDTEGHRGCTEKTSIRTVPAYAAIPERELNISS